MFTKTQIVIGVILYVIHLALMYIPALAKFKSLETKVDTAMQGAVTTLTAQVVQETENHIIPAVKNEVAKVTLALGLNKPITSTQQSEITTAVAATVAASA